MIDAIQLLLSKKKDHPAKNTRPKRTAVEIPAHPTISITTPIVRLSIAIMAKPTNSKPVGSTPKNLSPPDHTLIIANAHKALSIIAIVTGFTPERIP